MAKQTNTPKDWRLLAERDMSIADHLSVNMTPIPISVQPRYDLGMSLTVEDMRLVLMHTKTIRDFLQKEIPGLFL